MAVPTRGLKVTVRVPNADRSARFYKQLMRQYPFAAARALNDVAIEFQRVQREHNLKVFTIRKKGFWHRAVKINNADRATVKKLTSEVHINAPKRPDIFERQQFGGPRVPTKGRSALAIPSDDVERTASGVIKKREFPNMLKREFVIDFADGSRGLFVRSGRRQKAFTAGVDSFTRSNSLEHDPNVRYLYSLQPTADIVPVMDFYKNAREVFLGKLQRFYNERLAAAIRDTKF